MNEKIGEVFSITKDNQPIPGCTTSKAVNDTLGTTSRKSTSQTEISLLIQLLFT